MVNREFRTRKLWLPNHGDPYTCVLLWNMRICKIFASWAKSAKRKTPTAGLKVLFKKFFYRRKLLKFHFNIAVVKTQFKNRELFYLYFLQRVETGNSTLLYQCWWKHSKFLWLAEFLTICPVLFKFFFLLVVFWVTLFSFSLLSIEISTSIHWVKW